ncbi:hypothetical protein [Nocardioides insulae]|uniref:hypothetical protein n=1 Tax=Nocardioides insulae TaxID=394734 RepID=UPI000559F80D|nr:hypothetical protein [Nocardioides insulae]
MTGWYLRRAVPWRSVLGCLACGAVVALVVQRWEYTGSTLGPVLVLVTIAGAAFVFDEPAAAVAAVAPRGDRWARSARLTAAVVPLFGAVLLATTTPGPSGGDWIPVLCGLSALVLVSALAVASRGVSRPGSAVASAVVLVGTAPLVTGMFLDVDSPYPAPDLSSAVTGAWYAVAAVCLAGLLRLLLAGPARPAAPHAATGGTRAAPASQRQ